MKQKLESYILQIENFNELGKAELIDYFAYFITVVNEEETATSKQLKECFDVLRIEPYSNIPSYLSQKCKRGKGKKFIKKSSGYILERAVELEIQKTLSTGPSKKETSFLLRNLIEDIANSHQRSFLQEAIDCYEIGAKRASIVLAWILTVNHLYEYIFKHKKMEFDSVLAANTDKRIKILKITTIDDFTEIPEGKFIEFCRSSKIITNDVRKILEEKLGTRNSSAHPSAISISELKATEFIQDLIENVVLKYKI
ncbi:hypothetical protein [Gynuella sunshinyii]|uniref:RiboL-PSP-HEPN domain-containing protein n=1 Tax=Gynuella sunshinyii YC6258 TaxID=1445510 RepID=A0A0C5V8F4_9GAMM|nr:hypothetical protein [Gynuella sunshinyii]AJQ95665.1 hypothetical Protein YC6258_03629 [Gynuella sunshinyii YC6258]